MKSLKILICKLLLFFILSQFSLLAKDFSIHIGVYDFTDEAAKEFYIIAPSLMLSYDCLETSYLSLNISAGFSFNSVRYNSRRHNLFMVPIFISILYDLPNPESRIHPFIGGGLSLLGKADKNPSFEKPHFSGTYGYHIVGGISISINKKVMLTFEIKYNNLIPPSIENLNVSGIMSTIGIKVPLSSKK